MQEEDTTLRCRLRVEGIVQGVGFRPFVYALATRYRLTGQVGNDTQGVYVEVQGAPERVAGFRADLVSQAPPLAVVERVKAETIACRSDNGFRIASTDSAGRRRILVPPDTATCDDCLRELFDPADRRFRYPFTNCTNCGPRLTIITGVPYDRRATTMAGFAMCPDCSAEYHDPDDRRFHAQPVCCPECGPRARLMDSDGAEAAGEDPVEEAARLLRTGHIVAVKGLGGYHLAVDAESEAAVRELRARKDREGKPFAVMVSSLEAADELCDVGEEEARVLSGPQRPIVLLRRRSGSGLANDVAPGDRHLGLMLPYTPLHHLLARAFPRPMTLTSGNISDEPICHTEAGALSRLSGIADYLLTHDRPIHTHADDSVVRVVRGREYPVRRSRGYVPVPLTLPAPTERPVLGCGSELKTTFCLAAGDRAFLSQHIGDLENYETLHAYTTGIERFQRLFGIEPAVVAHDLHPEYLSTKYAVDRTGVEVVGVQHHHAHIAACLADNAETGSVIGVALDGLGYGSDGTLWGGELLVADLTGFERRGHLEPVPLPGGAAAIREPWRMAASYLDAAYEGDPPDDLPMVHRNAARWESVLAVARTGVNAPLTSSAGRLFDAVSALAGIRDRSSYEGQAAIELEQSADLGETSAYTAAITGTDPLRIHGTDLVRDVVDDLRDGAAPGTVAARFHNGFVSAIARACFKLSLESGICTVALSGGVFQNVLLLCRLRDELEQAGLRVLTHRNVPANDAGISFGQAAVAAARAGGR
ncbi:carbamoyltransferase HypF [Allosalinactinospora lopnorensis]|uniref:carbamoyltransferase HypF n=1 Tax=Allosalinactinospora lopnorensis TaxID=1352348 RepID=UPI000623DC27|nr:carbamoyltransferase HypF [Allosalinactinospora lopnorensis]